ncbi:DgyrCDS13679 [Dimorphilus gyrociliatus]|uniref:DgyrCDS13679 n=1 Tax=Dimorphilus gyrociliatus TaxID=2664684 RepID=A0A7I8WBE7_9ANNE|nr:DgyrCDS13679 [Dimorphilus gyrociliatus]
MQACEEYFYGASCEKFYRGVKLIEYVSHKHDQKPDVILSYRDCTVWCRKNSFCSGYSYNIATDGQIFCEENGEIIEKQFCPQLYYLRYDCIPESFDAVWNDKSTFWKTVNYDNVKRDINNMIKSDERYRCNSLKYHGRKNIAFLKSVSLTGTSSLNSLFHPHHAVDGVTNTNESFGGCLSVTSTNSVLSIYLGFSTQVHSVAILKNNDNFLPDVRILVNDTTCTDSSYVYQHLQELVFVCNIQNYGSVVSIESAEAFSLCEISVYSYHLNAGKSVFLRTDAFTRPTTNIVLNTIYPVNFAFPSHFLDLEDIFRVVSVTAKLTSSLINEYEVFVTKTLNILNSDKTSCPVNVDTVDCSLDSEGRYISFKPLTSTNHHMHSIEVFGEKITENSPKNLALNMPILQESGKFSPTFAVDGKYETSTELNQDDFISVYLGGRYSVTSFIIFYLNTQNMNITAGVNHQNLYFKEANCLSKQTIVSSNDNNYKMFDCSNPSPIGSVVKGMQITYSNSQSFIATMKFYILKDISQRNDTIELCDVHDTNTGGEILQGSIIQYFCKTTLEGRYFVLDTDERPYIESIIFYAKSYSFRRTGITILNLQTMFVDWFSSTFTNCAKLCFDQRDCRSFSFKWSDTACSISENFLTDNGQRLDSIAIYTLRA